MVKAQDLRSRRAIFGASMTAECQSLMLGVLAIHFSFLPVKGFHYDANAIFNEQTQETVHRVQFGQTLSVSHRVVGKLSLSGEVWHFTQPFLRGHAVGNLWALSYAAQKTLVFDAGFNRGLTSTSTHWEAFVGFTYLLPHRLW